MQRIVIGNTLCTLVALAVAGCQSDHAVGPVEPPHRPFRLSSVGSGDVNGNGFTCWRQIGDEVVGGGVDIGASVGSARISYVVVDDPGGVCPAGFQRRGLP